ncbi:hypothetical protein S40285_03354 [Stachybotrys chlorohalonatus IBT 40285]|uniref:Uncharacterized protein n=1 Tax=Stachybotrys chlorohalonatus (strain IBT 40285) TaxID=1283841 RepID=A0A084QQE0_STAC4|nr:hypothetical protein S40285_03354 [Stachybotrys chlorohalonata IBT 40285]
MASDEDYMAFLNKANEDTSNGHAASVKNKQPAQFKTKDSGSQVPGPIQAAVSDAVYTSDADEPFEAVSLKWEGNGLPDEVEFAKLIEHWDPESADITILDPIDWDSSGAYSKLIEAVREATRGNDVRVYRVTKDKTRAEYWLVSGEQGKIVGAKALSVES